jgi:ABC-type antimicrobial peptide transport system permease subunit
LGAVLLVRLGYLVVAFSALVAAQRKEFAILSALGWPPWQHARLFLVQALLFALGGGFVGVVVALLAIALLGAIPLWLIVVGTLPAMLVLALISAFYPLWQLWRIQPAEILRAGSSLSSKRTSLLGFPLWWVVSPITALVVRNLARARPRTLLTIRSLFLSAVLLVLMVSGVLALRQALQGTLLGDFVLMQTAVPQIAGGVFAVLLTFLSVADLLLLQVRERQQEIGLLQAVGWRSRMVQWLFIQEGMILALISTVPGVLVALGILAAQHTVQRTLLFPLVALGAVLLLVGVSTLATLPALRALNRMQVVEVLRAE